MCDSDSGVSISMNGSQSDSPLQRLVFIKITMPDETSEVFSFSPNDLIMDIKLVVVGKQSLPLKDELNYGLFLPPSKGKAGKFLQEDRMLLDYPFESSVGHLELKYKQRVYRVLKTNINKLRKINTKTNFRQFIENVKMADVDKVSKWLNKGLDPNFQWKQNGETPLTLAVQLEKPYEMIMALVAGGAHLDYRASDSMTPIHRASVKGNYEAIKVLLDLGQSPNTRDKLDLTPLYYAVLNNTISLCIERLLFDHSPLGISDEAGLQEIHQACRFGRVQHLEILLAYGADINVQTSKNGNTPLHICAYTGQESCARMLLFRGADKAIRNFNGHTPYEQAMISSNTDIANLIKNFHDQDVVPIREYPKRNQRRRSFSRARSHQRCSSMGRLNDISRNKNIQNALAEFDTLTTFEQDHCNTLKGNCTNKNNTWMTSSISGFQLNSMMLDSMEFNENKDNLQAIQAQSNQLAQTRSAYNINRLANGVNHRYHNPDDIVHTNHSATMRPSHGRRAGRSSTPAACHSTSESFKMNPLTDRHSTYRPSLDPAWMSQANENNSDTASIFSVSSSMRTPSTNSVKTTSAILQLLLANRDSIADLDTTNLPRMIALQRGTNGFGFVVRGKRGISENFTPSLECPASQYLEKIEPNSAASRAGLKAGDFILEVNGINVTTMSHEAVVALIRGSSDILGLKVITVNIEEVASTPKLQHQPNNVGNRFCESSDNLYNLRTRKYNCELNYPNDCCQASEINWSINVDNNCKTICRDSFLNAQNGISSQLNKSANESFMNGFVSTDKLNYIRQNSDLSDRNKYCHPSSSNTSLVTHNTVVPPPVSSKPMLAARNGLQNGTNLGERQKQNSQTNLNNKFRLCEKEGVSSNMVQKTVAVSHPLPLILPAFSSSISKSIPPPPPPPPLFTTATKNTSASKPEVPAGILKKSSPAMNELAEDSTTSKKPTEFQNQDGWSEQLTLPPPPPPDEFELSTSETEVQEPSVKYNCTNFQEKCKTQSTSGNSKISSFEENLRKAVAQRRRMIEMASEDDEQDFESLHGKSFQSMLYTESSVKSSKQQSDILPPNQNSFKMAAEKFHLKAIARNIPSNGTIPPPEKFKDCDNAFSKVDNNTGVNTSMSLETTKKPVIPQWQSCLIKNNAQCLTNNEKSKLSSNNSKTPELYASIKPFQNNGISGSNDNICSNKLPKDVTTFKQNTAAQSIKCFGRPLTQGSSTATPPPPPPPPPPLLFEDTPKAMWSARKNDSVKSLVR